ncbi:MAG: lipopolysaccharide heptosyltransferase II [Candidatus Omnitrophota bacterium]|jgi:heptosyltransferase-2
MSKKILFVTLSNIGDCILTLPVLDALLENFPGAEVTVVCGMRPQEIFRDNPRVKRLIVYDKHAGLKEKVGLFNALKGERFDIVVDLRNTLLGVLLRAAEKTSPFNRIPKSIRHMKDRHLFKVLKLKLRISRKAEDSSLHIGREDKEYIDSILKEHNINEDDRIVVIAPGARSHTKRWPRDKFAELANSLIEEFRVKVVLVGDNDDAPDNEYISAHARHPVLDLSARTNIRQLASLLKRSALVITNDSATLHLASYLDIPLVAIFGPTNEKKYRPWSRVYYVVKKDISCRPCEKAQCTFGTLKCMDIVKVEDVLRAVRNILVSGGKPPGAGPIPDLKRILIVRTDRIGDVLLSTPAIKAVRDSYPNAYIAVMVSPYARDIVEGNPYLDEVIIYDKDGRHKGWLGSLRLAARLKKKKFDLALILHPANRAHIVIFLAGIRRRVGYDRKMGFLLTDRIKHTKQLGEKHESEYVLDLAGHLGIKPEDKKLFMPVRPESEQWVEELFRYKGIQKTDKLLAVHPGASCPSKLWPNERFAAAADRLSEKYGFKVLVVAGPKDKELAESVVKNMRSPAVNLGGKTSVSQLASVLRRCDLFISNDSGPVHIAAAVGTPVISIFGRKQKGLSPLRWGPLGEKNKVIYKDVGCIECLAHNCAKEFTCLKSISVDDVVDAADSILK